MNREIQEHETYNKVHNNSITKLVWPTTKPHCFEGLTYAILRRDVWYTPVSY